MGEIHPAFFYHPAPADNPADTTSPFGTLPAVFDKASLAIGQFQSGTDSLLQIKQVTFYFLGIREGHETPPFYKVQVLTYGLSVFISEILRIVVGRLSPPSSPSNTKSRLEPK